MEWSNAACKGYILRAMRNANIDGETRHEIMQGLRWSLDDMTIDDAEREYEAYLNE